MDWPIKVKTGSPGRPRTKVLQEVPAPKRPVGRPKGSTGRGNVKARPENPYNRASGRTLSPRLQVAEIKRKAALSGDLPHEFLLKIMRGDMFYHDGEAVRPTIEMRIDCAKAAAPYFAPRLAQVQVTETMTDDDIDSIIKSASAEAGLSLSIGGEIKTGGQSQGTGTTVTTH